MKPAAKHVYRIGDRVTIAEPRIFQRVGYPTSHEAAVQHVEPLVREGLAALFEKVGARLDGGNRDYDRALSAIAHAYLRSVRYGGPERSIHTLLDEERRGREAAVAGKRCVKTGTYSTGWWDEDGGEPSFLRNETTHVLLEVQPVGELFEMPFEIEARHVRPIPTPTPATP